MNKIILELNQLFIHKTLLLKNKPLLSINLLKIENKKKKNQIKRNSRSRPKLLVKNLKNIEMRKGKLPYSSKD